jgi:hypothetical protein
MRRAAPATLAAVVVALVAALGFAQAAADCTVKLSVYVPLVRGGSIPAGAPGDTATATTPANTATASNTAVIGITHTTTPGPSPTRTGTPTISLTPTKTTTPTNTPTRTNTPTLTRTPTNTPTPTRDPSVCAAEYPTVCIAPPPPDLNCPDITFRRFTVLPPDRHNFDSDNDGIGCESG